MTPDELTPVETIDGVNYKREDALVAPNGVTGKLRVARHLLDRARDSGYSHVVYGGSVQSPAVARVATVAQQVGLGCTIVIGSTTPSKAYERHAPIRHAVHAGAEFYVNSVAYNPALQRTARRLADHHGWYLVPYGITTADDATPAEVREFLDVDAPQVDNLPDRTETLVVALGSGNSAAAIIHGLLTRRPDLTPALHLLSVGPSRWTWLLDRLAHVGHPPRDRWPFPVTVHDLHPTYAKWGDLMPGAVVDGFDLHPAYEGKMWRWLDETRPEWWRRDGTVTWWVVGGPIP